MKKLTEGEWSFGMQLMVVYVANIITCNGGHVEKIFNIHKPFLHVAHIISSKHAPSLNILMVCIRSILSSTAHQSRLSSPTLPISHIDFGVSPTYIARLLM